jgi:hypothetical protein
MNTIYKKICRNDFYTCEICISTLEMKGNLTLFEQQEEVVTHLLQKEIGPFFLGSLTKLNLF